MFFRAPSLSLSHSNCFPGETLRDISRILLEDASLRLSWGLFKSDTAFANIFENSSSSLKEKMLEFSIQKKRPANKLAIFQTNVRSATKAMLQKAAFEDSYGNVAR